MDFVWSFVGVIFIVIFYYIFDYIITLYNRFFNPYDTWYKENKEQVIHQTEELPGFGEWMRYIQKKSLLVLFIILFIIGIATWIFID